MASSSVWTSAARACIRAAPSARSMPANWHGLIRSSAGRCRNFSSGQTPRAALAQAVKLDTTEHESSNPPIPTEKVNNSEFPKFSSLKSRIHEGTLKAITVKPFNHKHMSVVQAQVLPLLPEIAEPYSATPPADGSPRPARDLLVKARTGTGKTLAFLVPAIESRLKALDAYVKESLQDAGMTSSKTLEARARRQMSRQDVGCLILSPTRELATQIAVEAQKLTQNHPGFEVQLFVGGMSRRGQLNGFMRGSRDIVVATPGRLRDVLSEHDVAVAFSNTKTFILDEADTLLDMGFRDDIEDIARHLPKTPERQTFLFSATVSPAIQQIARATLDKNHRFIDCVNKDDSPVHAHVPQYHSVLRSSAEQIPHTLRLLAHDQLTNPGSSKAIVFLPTTKLTQLYATLVSQLSKVLPAGRKTKVYEIHSKRSQESRSRTSDMFRKDQSGGAILITSDVSARGVDYPGVTRVIQVGIPGGPEQYVHRVGRTGRAGTKGRGDLVLQPWEVGFVTYQLKDVPMRPLTTTDLAAEISTLADKHDADPMSFFKGMAPAPPSVARGRVLRFDPVGPKVATLQQEVEETLTGVDEEAVKETFLSLLGYYIAKASELRVQKGTIVDGLKDWSVEAMGLPTPPYVSASFLEKLGVGNNRPRSNRGGYGSDRGGYGSDRAPRKDWGSRGSSRSRSDGGYGSGFGGGRDSGRGGGYGGGRSGGGRSDSGGYGYGSRR
ncbi:hypothetical protein PLICRDRAFT_156352 [Plicaturopsis crispa FD-325 SS-3]|nr:hypothetical protein PLICRDRAFT_156352 [Plicaturopsis crispa FD-325 SS-3]